MMRQWKKRGIIAGYEMLLAIFFCMIALAGIGFGGHRILTNMRFDKMKADVNELDQALLYYSMSHHSVDSTTAGLGNYSEKANIESPTDSGLYNSEGLSSYYRANKVQESGIYDDGYTVKLIYDNGPKYPSTTTELGLLLTQFGYLSHEIDAVQGSAWEIYSTEESQRKKNWYERGSSGQDTFNGAKLTYATRYKYTKTTSAPSSGSAGWVQEYSLTLTLPSGETYKSPHSAY